MFLKQRVLENQIIGYPSQNLYRLVLSGRSALQAKPGQFVHLKVTESSDPLLRRPISIAGIDREKEQLTLYYRVAGRGTQLLTNIKENDYLSVLGPLGTGFTVPEEGTLLLAAGGIGIFPLCSLMQAAAGKKVNIKLFWGAENKVFLESAGLAQILDQGISVQTSTMDGSLGSKGLVTNILKAYLASTSVSGPREKGLLRAAACGPRGMLKAVSEICHQEGLILEVSLEERMACGLGACLGCVCTVKDKEGRIRRKRVCKEGPVLDSREVVWDACE